MNIRPLFSDKKVTLSPFFKEQSRHRNGGFHISLHIFVDGLAQIIDGIRIACSHGIHHAVAHMILQDHLARVIQRGPNCRQLYQHIRTIVAFFYHPLHFFQVTNRPGQSVNDRFLIFVNMTVAMLNAVSMLMGMFVIHNAFPLFWTFYGIIPHFLPLCKPYGGIFPEK